VFYVGAELPITNATRLSESAGFARLTVSSNANSWQRFISQISRKERSANQFNLPSVALKMKVGRISRLPGP